LETKDLISDLMSFNLDDSEIVISISGQEYHIKDIREESGFYSKYQTVIYSDTDDYELVDKDELEELREQAGMAEDLEEEIIQLQELIDSLQEQVNES